MGRGDARGHRLRCALVLGAIADRQQPILGRSASPAATPRPTTLPWPEGGLIISDRYRYTGARWRSALPWHDDLHHHAHPLRALCLRASAAIPRRRILPASTPEMGDRSRYSSLMGDSVRAQRRGNLDGATERRDQRARYRSTELLCDRRCRHRRFVVVPAASGRSPGAVLGALIMQSLQSGMVLIAHRRANAEYRGRRRSGVGGLASILFTRDGRHGVIDAGKKRIMTDASDPWSN